MELTLVQELLHLHYAPFFVEKDDFVGVMQEQSIDQIAKALVFLNDKIKN